MASATHLTELKRQVSARLLDEPGVSGVGIRGRRIVVYLETDDPGPRQTAERVAAEVAPATKLTFEVAGRRYGSNYITMNQIELQSYPGGYDYSYARVFNLGPGVVRLNGVGLSVLT